MLKANLLRALVLSALALPDCSAARPKPDQATAPRIAILCDVLALRDSKPTPTLDVDENRKAAGALIEELSRQLTKKGYLVVSTATVGFGLLSSTTPQTVLIRKDGQEQNAPLPFLDGADDNFAQQFSAIGTELRAMAHSYSEANQSAVKSELTRSGDIVAWAEITSTITISARTSPKSGENDADETLIVAVRKPIVASWSKGMGSMMKLSFTSLASVSHVSPQALAMRENGFAEFYMVDAATGKLNFFSMQVPGPNWYSIESDLKRIGGNSLSKLGKAN